MPTAAHIALWVVQGWLAALFLVAGGMKLVQPAAALARRPGMDYVADRTATEMHLLGAAEVLGAVGLVAPWGLHVAPVLTPLAAACLATLMLGAVVVHRRRREAVALPGALLALCLVVTVGRAAALR